MAKRRVGRYPRAFRQMAVNRLNRSENVVALSEELGVHRRLLYKWRKQLSPDSKGELPEDLREFTLGKEINQLKRLLAEKTQEVDFSEVPCKNRGATPEERRCFRDGIYDQVREVMPLQGDLCVERMCCLAQVSRAGFYRWLAKQEPAVEEMETRAAIQQIAIEHKRRYGYRRTTAELRHRGMMVNHKRVARLMRADNLLALQRRAFLSTTDSAHSFEVYFNLAARMTLSGINQLWVADITYNQAAARIRLLSGRARCFFAKGGWVGTRSLIVFTAADTSIAESNCKSQTTARASSPLGSGRAVRFGRIWDAPGSISNDPKHEPPC